MDSKESFRLMLDSVVSDTGKTQEELAVELGYGKTYFSEALAPTGKVTDKLMSAFKKAFLENPKNESKAYVEALEKEIARLRGEKSLLNEVLIQVKEINSKINSPGQSKSPEGEVSKSESDNGPKLERGSVKPVDGGKKVGGAHSHKQSK